MLIVLFAVGTSGWILGQVEDSVFVASPEAIETIRISSETEKTRQTVNRALQRVLDNGDMRNVDTLFNETVALYEQERERYIEFRAVTPNKLKLNNEIRKWGALESARNRWLDQLSSYMTRANVSAEILEFEKETWELTRADAIVNDVPASVIATIDNTLALIDETSAEIDEQLAFSLDVSARITEQKIEISDIIADLENWSTSGELQAFYQRHEPIWNTPMKIFGSASRSKLTSAQGHFAAVKVYYRDFKWQVNIYLFISILLIVFIYYLRNRMLRVEFDDNDENLERVRHIVAKQTAVSCLYFLSVLALFYLGDLPGIVAESFLLIVLASSILILRPFMDRRFFWLIPIIMVLFVMDTSKTYVWFSSPGYRLYQYFESILILGALWYFLIPSSKLEGLEKSTINRILLIGARVLIPLNVISIVANTLGYTNLADIIIRLSVMGATVTVLAYGVMIVLGGVIGTSLSVYFAEHSNFNPKASEIIKTQTQRIVTWTSIFLWVLFILVSAELYRPLFNSLELWLTEPWTAGDFSITPGAVLSFFLVIVVAFILTRTIAVAIDGGVLNFLRIPRGVLPAISMVIRYMIVAFAIAVALGTLGVDMTKFGLLAGALGVGIGFGLQNIVANFIAGMILTFERPFSPGDTVEVNNMLGVVQKIGVRSSILQSFEGADVVIPNNTLLSNDLINWTKADQQKRVEVNIGAAYGTDPNVVRSILLQVVHDHPDVLNEPSPLALFSGFGNSSLDFRLLFWAPVDDWLRIKSEIGTEVYNKFAESDIEIPFPRQDITILNNKTEEDPAD